MNREIKFRAWDTTNGDIPKMVGWNELKQYPVWDVFLPLKEVELMQHTGMKDTEGKDIYEGDIVETEDLDNRQVIYFGNSFEMRRMDGNRAENMVWYFKVKVIGNIFENPELIKSI